MAWARTGWASVGSRKSRPCSTSRPVSKCWRSFRSATRRVRWEEARSSASRCVRWRISSGMAARSSESYRLGTSHGVDLRGPRRQGPIGPAHAAILTGKHLAAAGRTEHPLRLPLVEGDGEDGGPGLDAHVHPRPARAAVPAAEQHADVALEIRPRGHPDGLRITWDFADIAAIGLSLGVQRFEPGAGPVPALVRAAEQASPADGQDRPRSPAPDEHAVHIHGVVVHVLAMAHILPMLAAVEATDATADFDSAIDLIGIGGIGSQRENTLGRVGPGSHADFRETHRHGKLPPVLAAVFTAEDLTVLVTRVQHPRVMRIEQQRPDRQAVVRNVELVPVLSVVRAPVGAVLRTHIHGIGVLGVRGDGPDRGRLGQATSHELPAIITHGHAIEAGLDGAAWSGLTRP